MSVLSGFADLVARLADLLQPVFHTSAAAAAIVLFTMAVRLAVHPLSRASARGQRARAQLAPQLAALREKHAKNPERLQKAVMELHAKEKVSPLAGCLPGLLQLPAFLLMYQVFSRAEMGGEPNALLGHSLFTAPLGGRWTDALADGGVLGGPGVVYLVLFALVAAVATFGYRRTRAQLAAPQAAPIGQGPGGSGGPGMPGMPAALVKVLPLMSFLTLITVAVVPLAAALYVVTSTTWSAVERVILYPTNPTADTAPRSAI
ncbi:YidC/Oxa1 family membrane protein insertase [Streptomyces apocyni]|uniref:YidC/Oxa1 family membrane protein insertase n=1 Tax=Streptomyces apocyni TaxID=2654677 RepID=UPI0012EAE714|nr:YidC/Oxa1 family membrane protein insertase [Streptomyces apocyni]